MTCTRKRPFFSHSLMPRRAYLSPDERVRFDTPPMLTPEQRLILLDLPPWADTYLQGMQSPTNKVGFVL